ncbi:MAG: DUF2723 domain-containing protein [Bacteroidia bacterium]|jgi:MFS family permease|nr:DUF2723 domain-containing protein [Bacteroidia bacterium]GIV22516.1 MAG: membrane protein [Bacteroidia bacterium]
MDYRKQTRLFGGLVFLIALITYGLTVAPTASYWDCGEFIATANELEVPHPPGAPLYLVMARIFAMLAPSAEKVAYFINWVSVLAGAFTSLLIAWVTMHFTKKALGASDSLRIGFAGLVGGLISTFADSVWFNTVEAEVYAPSAFFTALVVWLMCVWEETEDLRRQNQILILIAFIFGLSIGVHLLNLLTLPGLALMYYFRKAEKPTWKGASIAFLVGGALLGFLQYGVIQYTVSLAWPLEKWLVGTTNPETGETTGLGLPFGSGLALFILFLFSVLGLLVWYSQKRQNPIWSTATLSLLFIYLGYSSYAVIFLRSQVNPPIDENDPENVSNFLSYLKREQYGEVPILWGTLYNAIPIGTEEKGDIYLRYPNTDKYVYEGPRLTYKYAAKDYRFFPRMWSPSHYSGQGPFSYVNFVRNKGADSQSPYDDKPTGIENLRFFLEYQLYHMYIRYFLMNFVGRESEVQDSRWESGFEFGRLKHLPTHRKKDPSKAHYYGLPLLLGILGLSWQYRRNRNHFWVLLMLFLFTGVAIILYLNQPPNQPRERDYSYVGSFILFAVWAGMGVAALAEAAERYLNRNLDAAVGIASLSVPALMATQNWKSHSRAGNYVPPDSAYNFLISCPPNAILFTNGDNDTFPLWYLQEVEGVRTDVRIVNLSLLNTDWYITQLKYQSANGAPPLPISVRDELFMGEKAATMPFKSQSLVLPINKQTFLQNYPEAGRFSADILADTIRWQIPVRGSRENSYLLKQDYMTLDIVLSNLKEGWKRPICFANTLPSFSYLGLQDYLYVRGQVYELLPLKPQGASRGSIYNAPIQDSLTYELLTKVYRYRNLDRPDIFYDSNTQRMIANYRSVFYRLGDFYAQKADTISDTLVRQALRAKGKELLSFLQARISRESCPMEPYQLAQEAGLWLALGDTIEAKKLYAEALKMLEEEIAYLRYERVSPDDMVSYGIEMVARGSMVVGDTLLSGRALKLYEESRSLLVPSNRRH